MKKTTKSSAEKAKKPVLRKKTVKDLASKKAVKGGAAPQFTAVKAATCWCRD